VILAFLPV
ncbi:UDP-N-acetylmuramate:L-alanyl-gamma-D-glutamyl- meso-diaminopimelate ligase, partial [Haemophilus influenzae]